MKKQPVIILGMHRSGTSLVSRCLEELGLFSGVAQDANHESLFFLDLNNWMMRSCNAFWDNPSNFELMTPLVEKELLRVIDAQMRQIFRRKKFLGWSKAFKYKNIRDLDIPWGWKDPRNTFTIDIWRKIFPQCRMLHIYRNPVDVANSLRQRELKEKERTESGAQRTAVNRMKEYFVRGTVRYQHSVRAKHLRESIRLWESYVRKAFSLDADSLLHIRYEDFIDAPLVQLKEIMAFIDLDFDESTARKAVKRIDPERKFPFLKSRELVGIYEEIEGNRLMKQLGYDGLA